MPLIAVTCNLSANKSSSSPSSEVYKKAEGTTHIKMSDCVITFYIRTYLNLFRIKFNITQIILIMMICFNIINIFLLAYPPIEL